MKKTIVIAAIHPWNIARAKKWRVPKGFRKVVITRKEDLTPETLRRIRPRYVFFPHWSWIIPEDVWKNFECIVFHMTDLPFGRGGSPLQNLLVRGIYKTKVSALRVGGGLDTGPIYTKRPLDLSKGSAAELYAKLSKITFSMMSALVKKRPTPRAQRGRAVSFHRRAPAMSHIPANLTNRQLYDFIRMLDAPGYPFAFLEHS